MVLTGTDQMGPETSTTDSFAPLNVIHEFCPGYLPPTIKSIYRYVIILLLSVVFCFSEEYTD